MAPPFHPARNKSALLSGYTPSRTGTAPDQPNPQLKPSGRKYNLLILKVAKLKRAMSGSIYFTAALGFGREYRMLINGANVASSNTEAMICLMEPTFCKAKTEAAAHEALSG